MILSMTGYGKGSAGNESFSVETEIKSINSRYLEVFLKMPPVFSTKEYELREFVKTRIKRGKINITITLRNNGNEDGLPVVNKEKIKAIVGFVNDLKKRAKITEKIKLEHLLAFSDVFSSGEEAGDDELELVKEAIDKAVSELLEMKRNEGSELEKDLRKRLKSIEDKIDTIESESRKSVEEYYRKLKERAKTLFQDLDIYNDRMMMELALIAERAEITEECVRLRSHLKFFEQSLKKDDEPGRKLNFICQEMNRESNTISSKTISTEITHNAVLIKEEIEKIREQIQNIE
jgi:uncharacterized protein (TIGR00255 family)